MVNEARVIFSGMKILHEGAWLSDHAVVVEAGKIKAIIPDEMIPNHLPATQQIFPATDYLIPGFIDLHIHGANGHDVMDGTGEALQEIRLSLAREGITGFLATTMTAPSEKIESVLQRIADSMNELAGAAILGVHLEGPFISPAKMGAQLNGTQQIGDIDLFKAWQQLANGAIKLVTLAPELPEALQFIHQLNELGVTVSVGHTNATYAETCAAIEAGCKHATHLFNAMRGLHQREPGAVGAALLSSQVKAELIVDGVHLHPAIVELAYRVKGDQHILLVTDAMRAKCLGDGQYELGGQTVVVRDREARLLDGTLAGSTLRMPEAIRNMVKFSGCSLIEAIQMASLNPARVLGMADRKGEIEVGMDADVVVMSEGFEVKLTMCEGRVVFEG